jgi:hypothetical protein
VCVCLNMNVFPKVFLGCGEQDNNITYHAQCHKFTVVHLNLEIWMRCAYKTLMLSGVVRAALHPASARAPTAAQPPALGCVRLSHSMIATYGASHSTRIALHSTQQQLVKPPALERVRFSLPT